MKKLCCEYMDYHVSFTCALHENPYDCPDQILIFDEACNEYGIIIHDGGSSNIKIHFCPWCGKKL